MTQYESTERVFQIEELIRLICSCCDRVSLSRLSRVSRQFLEPSLDFLWQDANVEHVCEALSPDVINVAIQGNVRQIHHRRFLNEDDWAKFDYYAKRIQRIYHDYSRYKTVRLSDDMYKMFFATCHSSSLFPNATELDFTSDDTSGSSSYWQCIRLFLSAHITNLQIDVRNCSPSETQAFLQQLHRHCPSMQKFSILGAEEHDVLTRDALSESIGRWTDLRSLQVPTLSNQAMVHTSKLPRFVSLSLDLCKEASCLGPWDSESFLALEKIDIAGSDAYLLDFLTATAHSSLREVLISLFGPVPPSIWQEIFTAISRRPSTAYLRKLYISEFMLDGEQNPIAIPLEISHLSPLFTLGHLTFVHIGVRGKVDISDDDAKNMSKAWPKLEKLYLCPRIYQAPGEVTTPRLSLFGLLPFVENCPNLDSLRVRFHAIYPKEEPLRMSKKPGKGTCNFKVTSLQANGCPISSPPSVACFLSSVFPNLDRVNCWTDGVNRDQWARVEELLPFFRDAREQERNGNSAQDTDNQPDSVEDNGTGVEDVNREN